LTDIMLCISVYCL